MARTKTALSAGARLGDYLTVGFLAMQCPVGKVRQTLEKNGAQSKRRRGLPHEVLVYFVMMMVLYADVAYAVNPQIHVALADQATRLPTGMLGLPDALQAADGAG